MSEKYTIDQTNNFIIKRETRELNIENFRNLLQELAAASAIYPDHSLLIDIREIPPLKNFSEVFTIVIETIRFHHAFRNRIAVIIRNEPARLERTKFFKAGLMISKYQLEYFIDYEKAIDWLSDIQEPT